MVRAHNILLICCAPTPLRSSGQSLLMIPKTRYKAREICAIRLRNALPGRPCRSPLKTLLFKQVFS